MLKEARRMILVNAVLGTSFGIANLIYAYFGNTSPHQTLWSPLWLTFHNAQAAATIGDIGAQTPNFSFYFFWALLLINVYFLFKLGRTHQPSPNC
jgi:hypothetical protein